MRLVRRFAFLIGSVLLGAVLLPASFAAKVQSFTGTVSDAMCGAKHMMPGDDAGCLRACDLAGQLRAQICGIDQCSADLD